jgi:hypothetical protein
LELVKAGANIPPFHALDFFKKKQNGWQRLKAVTRFSSK